MSSVSQAVSTSTFTSTFKIMDNFVQLGRRIDMFRPNHVICNMVTFFQLMMLIDEGQYQQAMVCYILLNDVLPAFVV